MKKGSKVLQGWSFPAAWTVIEYRRGKPQMKEGSRKMGRLVINGNQVYEIDEECMKKKRRKESEEKAMQNGTVKRSNERKQIRR